MSKRKIIFLIVGIICGLALLLLILSFVLREPEENPFENLAGDSGQEEQIDDIEVLKEEFNGLFQNTLVNGEYDTSSIEKVAMDKDLVYTAYTIQEQKEGKYDINLNIPVLNVSNPVGDQINQTTQKVFADKANEIILGATEYTIYTIDYQAYINNDILSLAIRATLKEGDNPQRYIAQTYNYNFVTKQMVTFDEALQIRGINLEDAEQKIRNQIRLANKQAETLQNLGYDVFTRDPESSMYDIQNSDNFILGENQRLYLIYAYGNTNYTTEYDVMIF